MMPRDDTKFADLNSVVAVDIVRLKVLLEINVVSPDITWSLWPSQLWITNELNVVVVLSMSKASSKVQRSTNRAASLTALIAFDHPNREPAPKLTSCFKVVYRLCDQSSIWSEPNW